jgi:Family of unknown function (DUF6065)
MDITFTKTNPDDIIDKLYYPSPASKKLPEWYKNMVGSFDDNKDAFAVSNSQTMKRCLPIFDAISLGYIICTFTDIYVQQTPEGNPQFSWSNAELNEVIQAHPPFQVMGYKGKDFPHGAFKFRNPWAIKTPKGYSTLFMNPSHHNNRPFQILEGVVDTDFYSSNVNFPFILNESNFEGLIPAGTPIVQVVPFKRDSFQMKMGGPEEIELAKNGHYKVRSVFINGYRNFFRVNKEYK